MLKYLSGVQVVKEEIGLSWFVIGSNSWGFLKKIINLVSQEQKTSWLVGWLQFSFQYGTQSCFLGYLVGWLVNI